MITFLMCEPAASAQSSHNNNNNNNNNDNNNNNTVFLKDMVCLRNICVNTLHKGDSIFTNNNNNNNFKIIQKICEHHTRKL
jgi:hypothetical protein